MVEHKAVNEKDENFLKKNCEKAVQLFATLKGFQLAVPERLKEFEGMCDEHLGCIHVAGCRSDLNSAHIKPVQSTPCQEGPTARNIATAENG